MDFVRLSISISPLLFALACGGGGGSVSLPQAPTITTQPASQSATLGNSTTFTVIANGSAPLTYQWYWNGALVTGATASTYSTPVAVPSDNQSSFLVTVTNAVGSVTSTVATLSVNGSPRPPKLGDLRFKDVDAFPLGVTWGLHTNINGGGMIEKYTNAVGTPLQIGWPGPDVPNGNSSDVGWFFNVGGLPNGAPGRTTTYQSGILASFQSDLASMNDPNTIISSLDFSAGQNAYGVQLIKVSTGGGYSIGGQTLAAMALQTAATGEGAAGRVITAVSLNSGQATYISYGWQGDPSTVYEASVATATVDTLGSAASTLAQQGYIITAFGGNDIDGFILVGTRVQGDTTPRQLAVPDSPGRGYSVVMYVFIYNPSTGASSEMYIGEM